jgi:hypothetical protein
MSEVVALILAAFPGAEEIEPRELIEPTAAPGTCSYPERHGAAHHPHTITGRPICFVCHPPAGVPR